MLYRIRGASIVVVMALTAGLSGSARTALANDCVEMNPPPSVQAKMQQQQRDMAVIAQGMDLISTARNAGRELTADEAAIVARARQLVESGTPLPMAYVPISRFGHRKRQTMLSLADVGDGHLAVTTKSKDTLDGLILHHEYIDRETLQVAPYRMIDTHVNKEIRFQAAQDAPVTVYYGRPNFQPNFKTDKVTPIHQTAAAASGVFQHGTADVKVAMDGLSATESVEFMRGVARATSRNLDQYLTSAFNLNTPLVDDRPSTLQSNNGQPKTLTDPYDIAKLALHLAKEGGWDKIAWDGASETRIPSLNFIELLGGYELLEKNGGVPAGQNINDYARAEGVKRLTELVHEAHSLGLETYISAGMRDRHMVDAVASGVDGVGVGFAMHFREPGSGVVGPLDPNLIRSALKFRTDAEATPRGRAARLLAQLDGRYAAGADKMTQTELGLRDRLFEAMRRNDTTAIQSALSSGSVR